MAAEHTPTGIKWTAIVMDERPATEKDPPQVITTIRVSADGNDIGMFVPARPEDGWKFLKLLMDANAACRSPAPPLPYPDQIYLSPGEHDRAMRHWGIDVD